MSVSRRFTGSKAKEPSPLTAAIASGDVSTTTFADARGGIYKPLMTLGRTRDISASPGEAADATVLDGPGSTLPESAGAPRRVLASECPMEDRVVAPDRYRMGPEIARGGIGRIVRARDTQLERTVALKELVRDDPIALARFQREIRITAELQHPNIVPLHDAGKWPNGQPFYAMKLVEGQTLAAALREQETQASRLSLVPVLLDVAEALAYAHSQGVVHRDLKPSNILVGPFGETVVIDWGLAKHVEDRDDTDGAEPRRGSAPDETGDGAIIGTPAYMPPEQARGQEVDFRADVYAIGAMLYHLIAGKGPYGGDDRAVLSKVKDAPPTPLLELSPGAPRDLVAIAAKAMAREPSSRYPTARELAEELRRYTTGGLVGAYRYGVIELLARFFEKQRAIVVTVLIALAALTGVAATGVKRITTERDRARQSAVSEARAHADAEQRVDQLLVEKARALLDRDPTESVAWLKKPRTIPPGAATIAAWAEERGVAERVLRGHQGPVTTVAFSADGQHIATGGDDKKVVLWDQRTGHATELTEHTDRVTKVAFSPDGRVLASASYDATVRLHDESGVLLRILSGPSAPVKTVAFSPTGASLCSVSTDGDVREWNAVTGTSRSRVAPVDRDPFCAFSPDGAWILSGSHGGALRLWNPTTGSVRELILHPGRAACAAFSPDGKTIASGGDDGTLRLTVVADGVSTILGREEAAVHAVAFSPDGHFLASAGMSGRVRLWTLSEKTARVVAEHNERVAALAFSNDGRFLTSSGWDRVVRVYDLTTQSGTVLRGHGDVVVALAFSPDGSHLASASWDKTVRVWSAHRNGRRVLHGHSIGAKTVAFSPDGRLVASGGHDDTVRIFDLASGRGVVKRGHTDHVYRVLFSPDGHWVASSSDDRTIRLWSVEGDSVRVFSGHQDDVEELAFSPDGSRLASGSEDGTARLWSIDGGPPVVLEHDHDVTAVAFDRSGKTLATASRDHQVRLWDGKTGDLRHVLRGHDDEVWGLAFSPDGRKLASASSDDSVILWTAEGERVRRFESLPGAHHVEFSPDGSHIAIAGAAPRLFICDLSRADCAELYGHTAVVHDLAFLPDGRTLATAGGDATVDIWDLETHERRVLEGHAAPVFGISASPDGHWLASASGDGDVRIWPVERPPTPDALHAFLDGLSHEELAPGMERPWREPLAPK